MPDLFGRHGWRAAEALTACAGGVQRTEAGKLTTDEDEAATAAMIGAMRDRRLSYREITDALNAAGYRAKRGGTWYPPTVRRVAKRLAA